MVTATISWTAHGQPSTGQDSVTISRDQQRQCLKWYQTVVYYQDTIIPTKDTLITRHEEFITYQEGEIQKRDERIQKADKKLKRRTWISGAAGATIASIIAAVLFGLVK